MALAEIIRLPHGEQTAHLDKLRKAAVLEAAKFDGPAMYAERSRHWRMQHGAWVEATCKAVAEIHCMSAFAMKIRPDGPRRASTPLKMARAQVCWTLIGLQMTQAEISRLTGHDRKMVRSMALAWDRFRTGRYV